MKARIMPEETQKKHIFIVIGEHSGDDLAASFIKEARSQGDSYHFTGIAGDKMQALGIKSLFPMQDIAVMGIVPVIKRLPLIIRRVYQCVDAIIEQKPDAVLLIDSPDFTHAVAKRVHKKNPSMPIYNWVCPSVWAWRSARAQKMAHYIAHVFTLLPFEPDILKKLKGPPATYTGHPLIYHQALKHITQQREKNTLNKTKKPHILLLPGSRRSEIKKHMPLLKETALSLKKLYPDVVFSMQTLPKQKHLIEKYTKNWSLKVDVKDTEEAKEKNFLKCDGALAASGTICLELALARIPFVAFYKIDFLATLMQRLIKIWSILLPNLILERPAFREYIGISAKADALAYGMKALIEETPEKKAWLKSCGEMREKMQQSRNPAALILEKIKADLK